MILCGFVIRTVFFFASRENCQRVTHRHTFASAFFSVFRVFRVFRGSTPVSFLVVAEGHAESIRGAILFGLAAWSCWAGSPT